ncbi:MAG: TIGR03936 family radical SAM-associated protein [Lachnospiraceae bacterium]|nr:TIGR03936 family radical SAM-associated protein [Lachnospiraceae bacterium]
MKVRIKFSKHGALKFIGHLDIMRYFQKVFRRSGIDIAYTEGFSPHQVMSFAAPLGVGLESDGEYMDVEFNSLESTEDVKRKMNEQMAEGMEVLSVVVLPEKSGSAMAAVAAAGYYIAFPDGFEPSQGWREAIKEFLQAEQILMEKQTKKSVLEIDLKPSIYDFRLSSYQGKNCLYLMVNASSAGNIKPAMVMEAIFKGLDLPFDAFRMSVTREDTYLNRGTEEEPLFVPMDQ